MTVKFRFNPENWGSSKSSEKEGEYDAEKGVLFLDGEIYLLVEARNEMLEKGDACFNIVNADGQNFGQVFRFVKDWEWTAMDRSTDLERSDVNRFIAVSKLLSNLV